MEEIAGEPGPGMGRVLLVVVIASLIFGALGGFAVGYLTRPSPAPVSREFTVLSFALEGVDEATAGVPHDVFVPDQIVVNRGDTVTIRFINTEDVPEAHTFTMGAPYAVNMVLGMGESDSFTFTANTAGVFAYRCTFHQPTMTGYLIVLG